MPANLTTKLGQLVDVLTPDTTNTRIGVANASPTRTLDVTGTFGASGASTLGGALTYGGVTLSNAVTGTGNMVLSASPTLTGTLAAATANFSGTVTGTTSANDAFIGNSTYASPTTLGHFKVQRGGVTKGYLGTDTSDNLALINSSGSAILSIGANSTFNSGLTLLAALTYGGVTLSNSVTGTGSMVLSASPTFTGTVQLTGSGASNSQLLASTGSTTGNLYINLSNTGGGAFFGVESSGGGNFAAYTTAYSCVIGSYAASRATHILAAGSIGITIGTTQAVRMPAYGAGTATFDASGNITSVSDPSQKIITGTYTDGLAAIVAASSDEFMGWHKWRPDSGMETESTYASFFARDNFPVSGAVTKNEDRPNSFNDRPVVMALVNAVAELKAEIEALKGTH
jgi:hypothetical protein